jgi:hypothetical protein
MDTQVKAELPRVVKRYFEAINFQDFQQAADLFVESGALIAPLGKCVRGRFEISQYLKDQCNGMNLFAEIIQTISEEMVVIEGHVHCLAFKAAVRWSFYLLNERLCVLRVEVITKLTQLSYLQGSKYASF